MIHAHHTSLGGLCCPRIHQWKAFKLTLGFFWHGPISLWASSFSSTTWCSSCPEQSEEHPRGTQMVLYSTSLLSLLNVTVAEQPSSATVCAPTTTTPFSLLHDTSCSDYPHSTFVCCLSFKTRMKPPSWQGFAYFVYKWIFSIWCIVILNKCLLKKWMDEFTPVLGLCQALSDQLLLLFLLSDLTWIKLSARGSQSFIWSSLQFCFE